jgi:hypothetical protein
MAKTDQIDRHLFYLFAYFSLHYTYGLLPIFQSDFIAAFGEQRVAPHNLVNSLAALFLVCSVGIISYKNKNALMATHLSKISIGWKNHLLTIVGLWFIVSAIQFFMEPTGDKIKGILNGIFMLVVTLICISAHSFSAIKLNEESLKKTTKGVFYLLLLMVTIQGLQFAIGRAWVCCNLVRPDALLFNPNNLGFWLLTVSAFFSFAHMRNLTPKLNVPAQCLIALSMLCAAPRAFIICIFLFHSTLIAMALIIRKEGLRRFKSSIPFYIALISFCISLESVPFKPQDSFVIHRLKINADRIMITPAVILEYLTGNNALISLFQKIVIPEDDIQRMNMAAGGLNNIKGRLDSEATDNAYIASFNQNGASFILWMFILLTPFLFLFRRRVIEVPGMQVLISFYLVLLISGLTMNIFRLFPSWPILVFTFAITFSVGFAYSEKSNTTSRD